MGGRGGDRRDREGRGGPIDVDAAPHFGGFVRGVTDPAEVPTALQCAPAVGQRELKIDRWQSCPLVSRWVRSKHRSRHASIGQRTCKARQQSTA